MVIIRVSIAIQEWLSPVLFFFFLNLFTLNFYLDTKTYGGACSPWIHLFLSQLIGYHSWVPNLLPYVECAKHNQFTEKMYFVCSKLRIYTLLPQSEFFKQMSTLDFSPKWSYCYLLVLWKGFCVHQKCVNPAAGTSFFGGFPSACAGLPVQQRDTCLTPLAIQNRETLREGDVTQLEVESFSQTPVLVHTSVALSNVSRWGI